MIGFMQPDHQTTVLNAEKAKNSVIENQHNISIRIKLELTEINQREAYREGREEGGWVREVGGIDLRHSHPVLPFPHHPQNVRNEWPVLQQSRPFFTILFDPVFTLALPADIQLLSHVRHATLRCLLFDIIQLVVLIDGRFEDVANLTSYAVSLLHSSSSRGVDLNNQSQQWINNLHTADGTPLHMPMIQSLDPLTHSHYLNDSLVVFYLLAQQSLDPSRAHFHQEILNTTLQTLLVHSFNEPNLFEHMPLLENTTAFLDKECGMVMKREVEESLYIVGRIVSEMVMGVMKQMKTQPFSLPFSFYPYVSDIQRVKLIEEHSFPLTIPPHFGSLSSHSFFSLSSSKPTVQTGTMRRKQKVAQHLLHLDENHMLRMREEGVSRVDSRALPRLFESLSIHGSRKPTHTGASKIGTGRTISTLNSSQLWCYDVVRHSAVHPPPLHHIGKHDMVPTEGITTRTPTGHPAKELNLARRIFGSSEKSTTPAASSASLVSKFPTSKVLLETAL
ncbi:hypothetical protein BLNAU_21221 [Blattamonas nauphoetae]|uniref:Uncharacterized protein n=1 Tax=Blattamonas nauphoetae TaxID=2049346 RepID=A0ABQ9WWK3_9EUKA|nr:hypothetical protein BLNAU_21221 [Blattamonas nauphoetae]